MRGVVEPLEMRTMLSSSTLVTVSGKANIYASGLIAPAIPPSPGGGGGGVYPTTINLSTLGKPSKLSFPAVSGTVSGWAAAGGFNGADGGKFWGGVTNVPAWGGISGVRDTNATMFLVGVFLGASGQPVKPPATNDVSAANSAVLAAPSLGQQFFVGDGRTIAQALQTVAVPAGATKLCLGFAENWAFGNPARLPGFYADNGGSLSVKVEATAQRHWSLKDSSVIIPAALAAKVDQVADAYFNATQKYLTVTDGLRTAAQQAALILGKLQSDGEAAVRKLYNPNPTLIDQIITAYNSAITNTARLSAMTSTVQKQISLGKYISSHLRGLAFDVSLAGMTPANATAFDAAVSAAGGRLVNEASTTLPHLHAQFS